MDSPAPLPLEEFDPARTAPGSRAAWECYHGPAPEQRDFGFPVLVARGNEPGPVILVTGGVHGDEYEGPVAVQEFFRELDPAGLRGYWLGVPVLHVAAFEAGRRCSPLDGKDLARVFPGDPAGTPTERLAWWFAQKVMRPATHFLDLHSGGAALRMVTLAGYKTVADESVLAAQRRMAAAFGCDLVWGTPPLLRPTLWQAEQFGIPAIYAETMGGGGLRRADVDAYKTGMRNVLRALGMLDGAYPSAPKRYFRETARQDSKEGHLQADCPAPCEGLFVPAVDLWDLVTERQALGRIVDLSGFPLRTIPAPRAGHVILIRHRAWVSAGDPLCVVVGGLQTSA